MALTASDVRFFFSGGLTNNDADSSLGGDISAFFVTSSRIFSDISPTEAEDGKTDYRCLYVNNISENVGDVLFDAGIFIDSQTEGGGVVTIGVPIINERQDFIVTNGTLVSGGNFTAQYFNLINDEWTSFQVDWAADVNDWASNFEIALRSLEGLENVTVTPSTSGSTITFRIDFLGNAASRYHEAMEFLFSTIDFTSVGATVTPTKVVSGSPIMSVADEISSDVHAPNNISFLTPTIDTPIVISDLKPGEFFPVWIKRVVDASTTALESDGFRLRLRGEVATS